MSTRCQNAHADLQGDPHREEEVVRQRGERRPGGDPFQHLHGQERADLEPDDAAGDARPGVQVLRGQPPQEDRRERGQDDQESDVVRES